MKIGVVCEGPTDHIAIEEFLGFELNNSGIDVDFVKLQPPADNTKRGGWTEVIFWLLNHPPENRLREFLGAGLFNKPSPVNNCDVLLVQIDSDILEDEAFLNKCNEHAIEVATSEGPLERGRQIVNILSEYASVTELCEIDRRRHIFSPTVESSETWCIAAFRHQPYNPEELGGQELVDEFGATLDASENRETLEGYAEISKSVKRWRKYCRKHRNSRFLMRQSEWFHYAFSQVVQFRELRDE